MKRRDFLRHLGTLAAAPVIVPLLPAIAAETGAGVVYHIDPIDCPMLSSITRGTASLVKHEWQTDTLYQLDDKTIMGTTPNGNVWSFTPTETPILVGPKGEGTT